MPRFMVNRNVAGWQHGDVIDVDEREYAGFIASGDLTPYPDDVEEPPAEPEPPAE